MIYVASIEIISGKKNSRGERTTYKTLGSVRRLIHYILREDKTRDHLKGGVYCNPDTAYDECILTKAIHNKLPTDAVSRSNQLSHFVQSFDAEEVTPELAKKIADELLEFKLFEGFQIVYAVHIDTKHIHTHFAINSVNYENGLRWHISSNELQQIKDYSDELCRKYNLSVIPKKDKTNQNENRRSRHMSSGEYRARNEGRSWKAETLYAGLAAKKVARNQEEFIGIMNSFGYQIRWEETRKDITYTTPAGKKINSDKLGFPARNYTPLTKENLEKQFAINRQVEENHNNTVLVEQEQLRHYLLKLANSLTHDNTNPYPFQNSDVLKQYNLEGQALKDKILESEKGKGIDWERD